MDTRVYLWAENPHHPGASSNGTITQSDSNTLATVVVSVELSDPSTGRPYAINDPAGSAHAPVVLSLPIDVVEGVDTFRCSYWSTALGVWLNDGVGLVGYLNGTAQCGSVHLTDFSATLSQAVSILSDDGAKLASISDSGTLVAAFDTSNLAAVVVVFSIIAGFLTLWIIAVRAENNLEISRRALYRIHIRRYGEVRYGLGLQAYHVPEDHPVRRRVLTVYQQLQVCPCIR